MKKYVVVALLVLLALAAYFIKFGFSPATSTTVGAIGEYADDVHYRTVSTTTADNAKILVQEFFWYGCPHCKNFESAVREYKKNLPDDVELVQIPVTWHEAASLHAAVHYVAMESEDPEPLQDALFETIISIRKEGNLQKHIDELESVFVAHGISAADFRSRLKSSEVQAKVSAAAEIMRAAGINGTPSIMVDGQWVVLNNQEAAKAGLFNVVDHLIGMARQNR